MRDKRIILKWTMFGISALIFIGAIIVYFLNHNWPKKADPDFGLRIFKIIFLLTSLIAFSVVTFFVAVSSVRSKNKSLQKRLDAWSEISFHVSKVNDDVITELPVGIIVVSEDGTCEWTNQMIFNIFGEDVRKKNIADLTSDMREALLSKKEIFTITYKNEKYDVHKKSKTNAYYFFNVTKREEIKAKYLEKIPVIGIISLDNFEEALSTLDVSLQSNVRGKYLSEIADWALQYEAFLKTSSNEKMIIFAKKSSLDRMINDKFSILEKIRNISYQHNLLVSISAGIASWDIDLAELSSYAQNAMELAEKRGGDQVVVNIENQEIAYFGAKLDQESSNSKVGARIKAENFKKVINHADEIYVMGHMNADTDAYAGMLGLTKLLLADGKEKTYMVIDEERLDNTVQKINSIVTQEDPSILEHQMRSEDVIKKANKNGLLIVVDTQSMKLVSSIDVFNYFERKAVIDHHRATEDSFSGVFEYLEPTASSTSELLIELMEFYQTKKTKISPLVASVMYSGILVDTNNFAHRTGARTFEAASKLKEYGADINEVRKWLRKDMERLSQINRLVSDTNLLFDNKIAVSISKDKISDLVLLAQTSDELLQIDGVEASFTIANMSSGAVNISARSIGSFNVQLIMELMGGGGHFSAAATKIKDKNIDEVYEDLVKYLEIEINQSGVEMKIILINDVKNYGQKNDVVTVKEGYGNFLIKNGDAILATEENLKNLDNNLKLAEDEKKKKTEMLKKLAAEINNKNVFVKVQVGTEGKLFGKVTTKEIAEEFFNQHKIVIDKRKIQLLSEINSIGIYNANVLLDTNINAKFTVNVTEG